MNYIVYKTTNLVNGKMYVGVHRTNPDIFDGYIGCGVSYRDKKKNKKGFPKAVQKYGYENFKRETLFIYPDTKEGHDAAYQKEAEIVTKEWVKSQNNYNLTIGGKFTVYETLKKEIAQYTIDGKFIRTWESIAEAQKKLGFTSIYNCVNGVSKYCGEYQWRVFTGNISDIDPIQTKEKTIYQFDLQGNLLKVWKSISEASKCFSNFNAAKTNISNALNQRTRQAFGYYWSFKNKFEYNPYTPEKAVAKYNDAGEFLESYTSIKEAAIANNIKTKENINAAIAGRQKRCGGFRWRYFYGDTKNIKPL